VNYEIQAIRICADMDGKNISLTAPLHAQFFLSAPTYLGKM
jgi:hypothetical protein